jgi:hypothetical protein
MQSHGGEGERGDGSGARSQRDTERQAAGMWPTSCEAPNTINRRLAVDERVFLHP